MTASDFTLDPTDWDAFRASAIRAVDDAIAYTRSLANRPVWQKMPEATRALFRAPLPSGPTPLPEILDDVRDHVLAHPMGNIHPRFWGWYMGASNLTGALGDFLAAVNGSNLGGGDHAARAVEEQVVDWLRQAMGLPEGASGTLVSGGSVANLIGLAVARHSAALAQGVDVREEGAAALPKPLRFYCSDQAHSCHQKSLEVMGLGNRALRRVPSDADLRMDLPALAAAVAEDRAAGLAPACVIATAGTVNAGAIDPLPEIADFCAAEGLWLHIDGCIGALAALAPMRRHLVVGLGRADSLALDPHKWLHAPFEIGCALVRDAGTHLATFSLTPEYLRRSERGLSAGPYWLFDLGLQTTRGFRALKLWMSLREQGIPRFGALIDRNIGQARELAELLKARGVEIVAPPVLNILCYRLNPGGMNEAALKRLNTEVMMRIQEQGIAVISDTTIKGRHSLRAAIANHRTQSADLKLFADELTRIGEEVMREGAQAAG
jgi:glutamate/tyrosine decarboxylase-like PLP-dependent enzyme